MKTIFITMTLLLLGRATPAQIAHSVPLNANESFNFMTGNELLRRCQGNSSDQIYCVAFIMGAVDMIGALQGSVDKDSQSYWKYRTVCLPKEAESGQIRDVVVKHLIEHPEERDRLAAQLVIITLIATWGCPAA